jgi:hypothetical protein
MATGDVTFEVPVPVRVDGTTERVDMTGGTGSLSVPKEDEIEIDPKNWLLRTR